MLIFFFFRTDPPSSRTIALLVEEFITYQGTRPGYVVDSGSEVGFSTAKNISTLDFRCTRRRNESLTNNFVKLTML